MEQEQFVQSAVKKQQRNKRKREPDMFVAAVLECTVRRICSEVCSSYFCVCSSSKKKRKLSISRESNETDTTDLIPDGGDSKSEIQNNSLYELQEIITMSDKPQSTASEDSQLEEFLQSLTTELNELLREIEGDSSHLDVLGDEIESLLNTSNDPFYPGLLEVLFP